jgi:restriction system protein
MSIPTYDKFIEPMLRYLSQHAEGAPASVVYEAIGSALGITENDKSTLLPSRTQPVYKNRAGWAHDRLKRAGLSSSPRRGYWKLTEQGLAYTASHNNPLTPDEVENLALANVNVRLRPRRDDDEIEHSSA